MSNVVSSYEELFRLPVQIEINSLARHIPKWTGMVMKYYYVSHNVKLDVEDNTLRNILIVSYVASQSMITIGSCDLIVIFLFGMT